MTSKDAAIAIFEGLTVELAEIHRGKHFTQWHGEAARRADRILRETPTFRDYATTRVYSGDGMSAKIDGRFGEWAIGRLVDKLKPEDVIAAFNAEVARNSAQYEEVSPAIGIVVDKEIALTSGVRLVPHLPLFEDITGYGHRYQWGMMPEGTGFLVQSYEVTPAFARLSDNSIDEGDITTTTDREAREVVKERFRRACLLASPGGLELPISVIMADRRALFQVDGTITSRPYAPRPHVSVPIDAERLAKIFNALDKVADRDVVQRAIDRLGRSRLFLDPVDRALDLGMAAEIILMHDAGRSNAEITYKIASRAAWLIGTDADERTAVFELMRDLYTARSTAVHTGKFPKKEPVDLDAADRLVAGTLRAIVERGGFPDWKRLALGGE